MGNRRYGPPSGQPVPLTDYHQSKDELAGLPQTVADKVPVTSTPNIFSSKSFSVSLVSGNVGTLIRHRGLVLPFVICLAAVAVCDVLARRKMAPGFQERTLI